jgi:hypothetical protein
MSDTRPTPAIEPSKCTEHKAVISELKHAEKRTDELKEEIKYARKDINKLKIDMAKVAVGMTFVLSILQFVIKYLPIGAANG